MQKVITGTIHQGDFKALKQIMRDQRSCTRYAYQRIHKDGLSKANDIVKACKPLYMAKLNQRYIQDAVLRAVNPKRACHLWWPKTLEQAPERPNYQDRVA